MKLMMNEQEYPKIMNYFTNRFPIEFLIAAFIVILLYKEMTLLITTGTINLAESFIWAETFLHATIGTVIVYFIKSRIMGGTFLISPKDFTQGEIFAYLPCISGTWLHQYQAGFLVIEKNELIFYSKKINGFVETYRWKDLSKVTVHVSHDKLNLLMYVIFGTNKSILITDGVSKHKIIFPRAIQTVDEMNLVLDELKLEK